MLEAPDRLNAGGIEYRVQNVYLKSRDAEAVLERLEEHIRLDVWQPEDRFDLAFVPHMRHPRMSSQEVLQRTLDLALAILDDNEDRVIEIILDIIQQPFEHGTEVYAVGTADFPIGHLAPDVFPHRMEGLPWALGII